MAGFDIIGDVHGHAERLQSLLVLMGYTEEDGVWSHPDRTAVFVGDLIDRGPGQLDTLRLVRAMVDAGSAQIVLGNHEFNAVAYATVDPVRLDYCRPHSEKNHDQHEAFLSDVPFGTPLHRSIIDWFRSISLWLDLDGLRVVHACWSEHDIAHLASVLDDDHTLNEGVVVDGTTSGRRTHTAIEHVLKGPEVSMDGHWYFDKGGVQRFEARVAWWNAGSTTLRSGAVVPDGTQLHDESDTPVGELPDTPFTDAVPRYRDPTPVVFGHYWNTGSLRLESPTTVCVDYSAGKGGPLVAYRWSGETELTIDHLESC